MVSAAQKAAIKASWTGANLQAAGTAFYVHLAADAPAVYAIFNMGSDPRGAKALAQGLRVMQFVNECVHSIDDMAAVQAKIDVLAHRHTGYGVKKGDFAPARGSFLSGLADALGANFTADARGAWGAFYDFIVAGLSAFLLSDAQKADIKASWAGANMQAAGTGFYVHLAAQAPAVYVKFNLGADPHGAKSQAQGLRVMQFVNQCVNSIDNMAIVQAKIDALAQRHISYNVKKSDFVPAKPCFLAGLADGLGGKFTTDARAAWAALYDVIVAGLGTYLVSSAQKSAIKTSWLGADLQHAGTGFYVHLAADVPAAYEAFNLGEDPNGAKAQAQGLKVMQFVDDCVKSIDNMAAVKDKIEALAHRHTGYPAKKEYFGPAKACFLAGLEEGLGVNFTAEARDAWAAFYDIIAIGLCQFLVSDSQKAAITTSWAGVALQAVGTTFYVNLARDVPDVYAVFNLGADPHGAKSQAQGLKVMQFVDTCVSSIQDMSAVLAKIDVLALRHTNYGAKKAHFPLAKASFLAALSEHLGTKFNDEAGAAWAVFYDVIASGLAAHLS